MYSEETENITFLGSVGMKEWEGVGIMVPGRVITLPRYPRLLTMPTLALKSVPVWTKWSSLFYSQ